MPGGPFADPVVYLAFRRVRRAFLFDAGDLSAFSSRDLLKVDHVFVSHAHMDHFIGFDTLLRLFLGRNKTVTFFGPAGFLGHVEGKLSGYTWNLVNRYQNPLQLRAAEVTETAMRVQSYPCNAAFLPPEKSISTGYTGTLVAEPAFTVAAAVLEHEIPCLAFCLAERFHINIRKERLDSLGLSVGPWLKRFKEALFANTPPDTAFFAGDVDDSPVFPLGELTEQIALITPGQKIGYVTDAGPGEANEHKIVSLVQDADHLFIEAPFLQKDSRLAENTRHLTAAGAGRIAGVAGVKRYTLMHISPRYTESADTEAIYNEARLAYNEARKDSP
jgi:ribonuclease Z